MLDINALLSLVKDMKHKKEVTINKQTCKGENSMKKTRFISSLLIVFLLMGMTAFAAESDSAPEAMVEEESTSTVVLSSARSASGYAAHYTDSLLDSFYIDVTGSDSLMGTVYLKAWDFPSTMDIYVTLLRPDGSTAFTDVKLQIGQEISKTFFNFQTGTYRLSYKVYGTYRGWIYARFSG